MRVDRVEFEDALRADDHRSSWRHFNRLRMWKNTNDLEQRDDIIRKALADSYGLTALSQAMIEPIRLTVEYGSRLRNILHTTESPSMELHMKGCIAEGMSLLCDIKGIPRLCSKIDDRMSWGKNFSEDISKDHSDSRPWLSTDLAQTKLSHHIINYEHDILQDLISLLPTTIIESIDDGKRFMRNGGVILCASRGVARDVCYELGIDLKDDEAHDHLIGSSKDVSVLKSCVPGVTFLPSPIEVGELADCESPHINIYSGTSETDEDFFHISVFWATIISVKKDALIMRLMT